MVALLAAGLIAFKNFILIYTSPTHIVLYFLIILKKKGAIQQFYNPYGGQQYYNPYSYYQQSNLMFYTIRDNYNYKMNKFLFIYGECLT